MEQKKELEERVVMSHKNTSDSIEEYIKAILAQAGIAELKRSEIADVFQVVPSQINYVIKTRFTESRGYVVESKRGGGGYIRIGRIEFSNHHELLCDLLHRVGEQISQQVFTDIIQLLFDEKIMTEREGNLLLATATDRVLGTDAARIRARMLKKILQQVDRKGKN
ncbi:transcriptional regulator CtsR [Streptococcus anginosus]|uniref:Transcriptional regulator CtsR n=3 Tax=Streptococcus TaxID=1301 RepID=A0A4U9ZZW0_STRAP|nr:transcriptional regulator CtsR [Streptococcus anginosus SK1138]VEE13269.1 transcriptional regulator CtsR [Streptococcus milleri]VTS46580.1 transcriptional regulator CtsR [Streptococcus anginosus]